MEQRANPGAYQLVIIGEQDYGSASSTSLSAFERPQLAGWTEQREAGVDAGALPLAPTRSAPGRRSAGRTLVMGSCTKLDENLYSQVIPENFYKTKGEVLSAVVRPFTHARAWATMNDRHGYWRLQELPADQLAWPQKGRHGYDGAQWFRQHYHTWTLTDRAIEEPWELIYWAIGFCNQCHC